MSKPVGQELIQQITKTRLDMVKTQGEIAKVEASISEQIAKHRNKLDMLRKSDSELQAHLKAAMEVAGVKKLENEVLTITYIAPTTRTSLDVEKIREQHPEIVAECSKTTEVRAGIKIKVKE